MMIEVVCVNQAEHEVHFLVDSLGYPGISTWLLGRQGQIGAGGLGTLAVEPRLVTDTTSDAFSAMCELVAEKLQVDRDEVGMVIDLMEVLKDGTCARRMQENQPYYFVHAYEGE